MRNFYLLTSFICGAIVMIVEIVGTKILSPFFGSGLFVWSSSITVAMFALSIGYFVGGKKADKIESLSDYLYMIVFVIGIVLLFTYDLSKIIYLFYNYLDIKISTFLSAFVLLFAPLTLLGMVSPIIVKLTTKEFKEIGKDLGFISAISTVGSLVGSLLAGFILLSYLGTKEIFFYCAITLMCLSSFFFMKKKNYIFIGIMIAMVFLAPKINKPLLEIENLNIVTIDKKEGFYGTVSVIDIEQLQEGNVKPRLMLLDGMPQGEVDRVSNKSLFLYHHVIEEIIDQLHNKNNYKDILFVGIGAGLMPTNLKDKFNLTLVDINPVVVDFAKKYFKLTKEVVVEDARVFINKSKKKEDIIVVDVFSGETLPSHLLTQEFMKMMKSHLNQNGAVIFNVIGNPYDGMASKSIIKTISSEFSNVNVVSLKAPNINVINYIVVAKNDNLQIDKKDFIANLSERVAFAKGLKSKVNDESIDLISDMRRYNDGDIMTDNFNKIDFYSLSERQEVRKSLSNFLLAVN